MVRKDATIPERAPLPAKLVTELAALRAMPDETIDTSDIPQLTEEFWAHAKRNELNSTQK